MSGAEYLGSSRGHEHYGGRWKSEGDIMRCTCGHPIICTHAFGGSTEWRRITERHMARLLRRSERSRARAVAGRGDT